MSYAASGNAGVGKYSEMFTSKSIIILASKESVGKRIEN